MSGEHDRGTDVGDLHTKVAKFRTFLGDVRAQKRVRSIAMAITRDPDRALDAVQETLKWMWERGLALYENAVPIEFYIFSHLRWRAHDLNRKAHLQNLRFAPLKNGAAVMSHEKAPDKCAEENDDRQQLECVMSSLGWRQRLALSLFYLDGMSYQEGAATMDITDGAFKVLLNRARSALKELLKVKYRTEHAESQDLGSTATSCHV